MEKSQYKNSKRVSRHKRIRAKISGTTTRPRLAVFRSNRFVYAQLIDDTTGKTLVASDTRKQEGKTLVERSVSLGTEVAKKAKTAGINDRRFGRCGKSRRISVLRNY